MKFIRTISIIALFGVLYCFISTKPAFACATGVTTVDVFEKSTIVVKATVQQTDDIHLNGILRVHEYFKGVSRPEYIVLAQKTQPHINMILYGVGILGECSSSFDDYLSIGKTRYYFLMRLDDGSYRPTADSWSSIFSFSDTYPTQSISQAISSEQWEFRDVNEQEFVEFLEDLANVKPSSPEAVPLPYPLTAPLLVTTNNGTKYIIPVDGGVVTKQVFEQGAYTDDMPDYTQYRLSLSNPPGCFATNCTAYSPNGIYQAALTKTGFLTKDGSSSLVNEERVNAFLWAPTRFVRFAAWMEDTLEIDKVSIPLNDSKTALEFAPRALCSPDGNLFAYSDKAGLWLVKLDAGKANPRLLIKTESKDDIPVPRYFSPYGRYLAITNGQKRFIVDLKSNRQLPDGLVSPNERYLLAFEENESAIRSGVCELESSDCRDVYYSSLNKIDGKVMWINADVYLAVSCGEIASTENLCRVYRHYVDLTDSQPSVVFNEGSQLYVRGYDFDYEPASDSLAVVTNKTMLDINGVIIDLSQDLDGDIADIRWWPSLLYKR